MSQRLGYRQNLKNKYLKKPQKNSYTYMIWLNKLKLPKLVEITDCLYEIVEKHKQIPQQCFNCQKFGRVVRYYRRLEKTCVRLMKKDTLFWSVVTQQAAFIASKTTMLMTKHVIGIK